MAVINYIPPATWNAQQMDWNAPQMRKARYADAMRLALLERAKEVSDIIAATLAHPGVTPYPYRRLSYNALKTFHDSVMKLIPLFANHITMNGAVSSFKEIPNWTKDTLCAYLKLARLIEPARHQFNVSEWAKQMYAIINLLLYTSHTVAVTDNGGYIGFLKENRSASAGISQAFSTFNYWGGGASWTAGKSETLSENTNPYVTAPLIGNRAQRLMEYNEGKFAAAEWTVSGNSGAIGSSAYAGGGGGGGTGTGNEFCLAQKSVDRLSFLVINKTAVVWPEFTVAIKGIKGDQIIDQQTLQIPKLLPGAEYRVLIKTMPEFETKEVYLTSKGSPLGDVPSESIGYEYQFPQSIPSKNYALVAHDFKFMP